MDKEAGRMTRNTEYRGPVECRELGRFVGQVMDQAGQTPTSLGTSIYGPGRSTWYAFKNGEQDISPTLLATIIREFAPRGDQHRLQEQAKHFLSEAKRARAGKGLPAAVQRPAFPIVVEAVAEVIWGSAESVFVRDTANPRRTGELLAEHLPWDRTIPADLSVRYPIGDTIAGHFVTDRNGTHFTERHGQLSPWHQWVRIYQRGATFRATVSRVTAKGDVFIDLQHGGTSRIVPSQVTGELVKGTQLEVTIRSILPKQRCINVTRSGWSAPAPTPTRASSVDLALLAGCPQEGERMWATVTSPRPEKAFILLALEGYPQLPGNSLAILYHTAMSTPLKEALLGDQVRVGDRLFVEVLLARPDLKRSGKVQVHVREIPEGPVDTALPGSEGNVEDDSPHSGEN
ncbi:hypothetical protein ACFC1L_42180 [Streptomyces sp. NPDC056210]|uniref:hypothetical protein n=1 Tax=Streptomyces sp. NPDC056210 TaxID=3345746 RepID=UPI0035E081D7